MPNNRLHAEPANDAGPVSPTLALFNWQNMKTDTLFETLYQSIFPIAYTDENDFVHMIGTSILVRNNDVPYLATAAHILRRHGSKYPLYVLFETKAVSLPGPAFMSGLPSKKNPLDLDIALFPLSAQTELWDQFSGYKTISLKEFDNSIDYVSDCYYIFGYPWRKSRYLPDSKEITSKPLSYSTEKITDISLFKKYAKTEQTHILVKYIQNNTKNSLGEIRTAPMPHGVSGGPFYSGH